MMNKDGWIKMDKDDVAHTHTHDNPKTMAYSKTVRRVKFIAIQTYLKKHVTSHINNLTLHVKKLEKEE